MRLDPCPAAGQGPKLLACSLPRPNAHRIEAESMVSANTVSGSCGILRILGSSARIRMLPVP